MINTFKMIAGMCKAYCRRSSEMFGADEPGTDTTSARHDHVKRARTTRGAGTVLLSVLVLAMATLSASGQKILIDYDTTAPYDDDVRYGGFSGLSDGDWGNIWTNIGSEKAEKVFTTTPAPLGVPAPAGSAEHIVLEGGGERIAAQDTGHTLAAGDEFDVGYMWVNSGNTQPDEPAGFHLYYTADDTIDDSAMFVASVTNYAQGAVNTAWWTERTNGVAVSGDGVGKTLFIQFWGADAAGQYTRLDNVYLAVHVVPGTLLIVQ